ncbi:VanZ family protein [Microbacterium bovistercoris]|uniref:VanZ family protein n=1 Tax=Microbacterium bovistercoris TaxID=2293570 RepID=UPI0015F27CE6|nr:VanZ family protein [Microbacterium bovistercoris]
MRREALLAASACIYAIVLALIAFWPQHVDSAVPSRFWRMLETTIPFITYERVEFGANILLFVPLGILLALLLPARRWLAVPSAALVSAVIETVQGVFISGRTASILDVVANVIGASIGLAIVAIAYRARRRRA